MLLLLNLNFIITGLFSFHFLAGCGTLLETWWTQFPLFSVLPFSLGFVFSYLSSIASSGFRNLECLACTYSLIVGLYFSWRFLSRRDRLPRLANHPDIQFFVWNLYCLVRFEHLFGCSRFLALILISSESDLGWFRFAILFDGHLCNLACRLFVLSSSLSFWDFFHSFRTCSYFPFEHLLISHKDSTYLRESLLPETSYPGYYYHSNLFSLSCKVMATDPTPHTTRIHPTSLSIVIYSYCSWSLSMIRAYSCSIFYHICNHWCWSTWPVYNVIFRESARLILYACCFAWLFAVK